MNTPLSLVQELRGIRGGQKHTQADLEGLLSEIREARREWQEQVDQAQHFLHDLLAAVADLSGVELPGIVVDAQKDGDGSLRLGFKTLKERIRNELEGYASTSAAEIAKDVHGKGNLVFEPLEKEVNERMDNLAEEFREKLKARLESEQDEVANQARLRTEEMLQSKMNDFAEWIKLMTEGSVASVPAEVQKSLEPHVEQVKDRLKNTFQQHLNMVAMESERAAKSKVDSIKEEIQSLVDGLSGQTRKACAESAERAMKDFNNDIGVTAQESARKFEEGCQASTDLSQNAFKVQLEGLSSTSMQELQAFADGHMDDFKKKMVTAAEELQQKNAAEIAGNVQKAAQDVLNSSLAQVKERMDEALEQSKRDLKATMGLLSESARKQMDDHVSVTGQESARQFGEACRASTEQYQNDFKAQLNGLSAASMQELQSFGHSHVDGFKKELVATAEELQQKSAAEIAGNVQEAAQGALNSSLAQVKERMDEALEQSKAELKDTMSTVSESVRKQMDDFALSARNSLAEEAARVSDKLRNLGEELQSSENQRIDAMAATMANLSRQTLERHGQSIQEVADAHVEEIRKSLSGLQDRMTSDFEVQLRQFMEVQRKTMVEEVQKQVADASAIAVNQIKTSTGQVVEDLSGKVNKEVNTATTLLNQWAHQTTTWAEASIKESLDSYKRQVAEFTSTLLEDQRATIQDRIGDLQERLEQAADLLRGPGVAAPELQKAPERQTA